MTLVTRDFHNVEIFKVGEWNGHKFTHKDLDTMVSSYQATRGKLDIPIKLGHTDKQRFLDADDLPAAGWLDNIRRAGDKLIADFMKVPAKVADLIESGGFRKRSMEVWPQFKVEDTTYPQVVTGLALLGSKLPAVDGLTDIIALYEREIMAEVPEGLDLLYFESDQEDTLETVLEGISSAHQRAERYFKGKPGAPTLRSLHRAFIEGILRANKLTHGKDTEDMTLEADLREKFGIAEGADLMAELEKKVTPATPPAQPPASNDEDKSEFSKLSQEILELRGVLAEKEAVEAVDALLKEGRLVPAQKDVAIKMARKDMDGFKVFAETLPKGRVDFGEHGSEDSRNNFTQFEPTAAEIDVAKSMNIWSPEHRINLMRQKASKAGIELPADFGKEAAK